MFVLSPETVKSDVALKEAAYAASLNKRFAPIVCRRVADLAVPEPLRRLNFIFFDEPTQFETSGHLTSAFFSGGLIISTISPFGPNASVGAVQRNVRS